MAAIDLFAIVPKHLALLYLNINNGVIARVGIVEKQNKCIVSSILQIPEGRYV